MLANFRQHAIANGLDDPAVMLLDLRIEQCDEMRLDAFVGSFLIRTHQASPPRPRRGLRRDGVWQSWCSLPGQR
jgi:hypothetical protein